MKKLHLSSLLIVIATFVFISASAQTAQQPSGKKTVAKSESAKQTGKSATAVSGEKKVEPITDGIINVKDEPKYLEQKKKEQEKKNTVQHTDTPK